MLEKLPAGEARAPYYVQLIVDDRPGVLADIARCLATHEVSIAQLIQHQGDGEATLHVVTHVTASGALAAALAEIEALPETRARSTAFPVVPERVT